MIGCCRKCGDWYVLVGIDCYWIGWDDGGLCYWCGVGVVGVGVELYDWGCWESCVGWCYIVCWLFVVFGVVGWFGDIGRCCYWCWKLCGMVGLYGVCGYFGVVGMYWELVVDIDLGCVWWWLMVFGVLWVVSGMLFLCYI